MGLWKGAWYLAKHEIANDGWKCLFTLLIVGYLLLFTVPLLDGMMEGSDIGKMEGSGIGTMSWATDFIYLSFLPFLGFVFNKTMMRYWRENTYTRKMALWRTLPISSGQIALGRIIHLAIILFFAHLIFFILQFIFLSNMGTELSVSSFALYAIFWFGYSLSIAIVYVYWELGHTGKIYFISNLCYIIVILLISSLMSFLDIGNVVVASFEAVENGFWWLPVVAIIVSGIAVVIGVNRIASRLENRTYRA